MFTFILPAYGNSTFTAHDESKFHDLTDDNVYSICEEKRMKYSRCIDKQIETCADILPGDVVLMSPYWYESRPYYGLLIVILDINGNKTYDNFGDGFNKYSAVPLYKTLLENNPNFFESVQDDISCAIHGRYSTMTNEIKQLISTYEESDRKQIEKMNNIVKIPVEKKKYRGIAVNKYKLDGTFIRTYKSLAAAVKSVNRTSGTDLHIAIKESDGIYRNYQWTLA